MSQLLLQGFPDGAIKIGPFLSILEKDGIRTYFTGADNYFPAKSGSLKIVIDGDFRFVKV